MKFIDIYSVGKMFTLSVMLDNGKQEFIQCIVKEHTGVFGVDDLREIKVEQILNLEDYFNGLILDNTRERVIRTERITNTIFL